MKKRITVILPIILSMFSCNNNRIVNLTINSGAGAFGNLQIEMTYQVPAGSRLSDLSVDLPGTFFHFMSAESADFPTAIPARWQVENEVVGYDYVVNHDTTITALYFHSMEEAKSLCYGDMLYYYFYAFDPYVSRQWDDEISQSFAQIEPFVNAAENEYQLLAINLATVAGDMGACKRLALNNKGDSFKTLGVLRQAIYFTELKAKNQLSVGISKIFASLFDAIGETFDPNNPTRVNWLNGFINLMGECTETLPAVCYTGLGSCVQAYIGAIKRCMIGNKDEALPKMPSLINIYLDGLMQCKSVGQADSIGKFGAAIMDAAAENYPNNFEEYITLSKHQIEMFLKEDGNL